MKLEIAVKQPDLLKVEFGEILTEQKIANPLNINLANFNILLPSSKFCSTRKWFHSVSKQNMNPYKYLQQPNAYLKEEKLLSEPCTRKRQIFQPTIEQPNSITHRSIKRRRNTISMQENTNRWKIWLQEKVFYNRHISLIHWAR